MRRIGIVALLVAVCGVGLWWRGLGEQGPTLSNATDAGTDAKVRAQTFADARQLVLLASDGGLRSGQRDELGSGQAVVFDAGSASPVASLNEAQAQARVEAWLDENASEAARAVEAFCATAAKVQRPSEPGASGGSRDARVFMVGKLDTEGIPPFIGALHLSEALVDELKGLGDEWFSRIEARHLQGIDFAWMATLHEFDVWGGPPIDETAMPNYARMKWWVLLRLALGRLKGDFEGAWADVERFSRLIRSQGNLVAEVTSYQFMELAEQARLQAQQIGLRVPSNSVNYGELKSLSRAAPAFLYPRVPNAVAKRALKCFPPLCGGLAEAAGMQRILSPFGVVPDLDLSACPAVVEGAAKLAPLVPSQAMDYVSDDTPLRRFTR